MTKSGGVTTAAALCEGGDDRITVSPQLRMNKYNATNAPVTGIMRGSCTCSVPSARAFAIGQAVLGRIQDGQSEALAAEMRDQLRSVWKLEGSTSMTFFPSGTDVEFMFVLLALGRALEVAGEGARVLSIVTCAGEVGSGTTKAAAGLHFSELLPSGSPGEIGKPVLKADSSACNLKSVEVKLRTATGELRAVDDVDAEVEALVSEALTTGTADVCVVHLVAGCKTGHVAASRGLVQRLRERFGTGVLPLLDACQGRLKDDVPADFVQDGYGVMMTGSKFYCGPPFSGVALMNDSLTAELRKYFSMPAFAAMIHGSSLKEYLALPLIDPMFQEGMAPALPSTLEGGALAITRGTLLRWAMALVHIKEWHAIPTPRRDALIASWVGSVTSAIARLQTPALAVLQEDMLAGADAAGVFPVSSIVSLRCKLRCSGQWRDPTIDELRHAHRLMAMDLRDRDHVLKHPAEALRIVSQRCFIAQPVALGSKAAPIIRVALGASQIAEADQAISENGAETSEWPRSHEDELVFRKMALIFSDWDIWGRAEEGIPSVIDKVKYDFHCWDEQSHGKVTVSQFQQLLQTLGSQPLAHESTDRLFRELLGGQGKDDIGDVTIRYEDAIEFFIASPLVLRACL
mmetsp:Transcript_17391/g.40613  ORF Transcript_17391/g.40613 Transcript_17391/m.40613 type:complete len:631 (-) Transcript_17391:99-1991(-)|eukprot:CAMPEP_0178420312 /NCGR_PEP_ID=MMETSP0689_2-20121128/26063_1 /TAXON_ID=160604 /ORGANISM="Amphidinium massartii, Strain CS-259" /LENGTH=630 /DNA_ID=CAMNT_0020041781 /DNA_START=1 /DNA_END=1893 /DNA_ORIENTATION=+